MRIDEFETLVAHKKMALKRRVKVPRTEANGDPQEIFLAEGYCAGDRDDWNPHYKTMYAIADDPERITLGEFFTTPIIFPIVSEQDRLDEAEFRAREFLRDMRADCPK